MKVTSKNYVLEICAVFLLFASSAAALAEPAGKIPTEVIDHAAANGTVLVLVGLKVPWQMESNLSEDQVQAQREAIASIQKNLLSELTGKTYKITRQYVCEEMDQDFGRRSKNSYMSLHTERPLDVNQHWYPKRPN